MLPHIQVIRPVGPRGGGVGAHLVGKPLDRAELARFFALSMVIDPSGRLVTDLGPAVRSLVGSFERIGCGQIKLGPGGCGKTTSAKLQRCVAGPYGRDAPVDATFQDTMTAIELRIGHIADRPVVIDEFRPDHDPKQAKALEPRKRNGVGSIGFFQIGGGIAGDFPICVVPMLHQDLQRTSVPLWGYFCQISDSTTSYGSYSGAVPNEKITWGKLGIDTPKFIVESDATIVAPLIFAWLLDQ